MPDSTAKSNPPLPTTTTTAYMRTPTVVESDRGRCAGKVPWTAAELLHKIQDRDWVFLPDDLNGLYYNLYRQHPAMFNHQLEHGWAETFIAGYLAKCAPLSSSISSVSSLPRVSCLSLFARFSLFPLCLVSFFSLSIRV
jgi:hypothetical protein